MSFKIQKDFGFLPLHAPYSTPCSVLRVLLIGKNKVFQVTDVVIVNISRSYK